MDHIASILNSNDEFKMDDTFHLDLVHVAHSPKGGGTEKRYIPGNRPIKKLHELKQTVVRIDSDDTQLCCARAFVTAKAKVDNHPKWRSFLRGRSMQMDEAIKLHINAGVPLGACGPTELRRFLIHL